MQKYENVFVMDHPLIQHNDIPLLDILGQLVVVLHGLQRFMVPVEADMAHLRRGY